MKNIIFASIIFGIMCSVIYFLKINNPDPIYNTEFIPTSQSEIVKVDITSLQLENNKDEDTLKIEPNSSQNAIIKITENKAIQDDRILFPGLDLSKFSNFKIERSVSNDLVISSSIFPIFGIARSTLSIVKIGTSDQGDVYFNGGLKMLESALNQDGENFDKYIAFKIDDVVVSIDASNPYNSTNLDLNASVDSIIIENKVLSINQLPACAKFDNRTYEIEGLLNTFTSETCENGYKELDVSNLIKIKDPVFYQCLTSGVQKEANLGNDIIPFGWVNADDIVSIECKMQLVESANEIVHFKNLQRMSISTDFPNLELIDTLENLKYLYVLSPERNHSDFDLVNIKNLNKLESVLFYDVNLLSTSFLNHKNSIKTLVLDNTIVDNYHFLEFLDNVDYFDISKNELIQMPNIGFEKSVGTIKADFNNFEDIYGFEKFEKLHTLNLRSNKITSIDNLNLNNSNYQDIELFGNKINCDQKEVNKYSFLKVRCESI